MPGEPPTLSKEDLYTRLAEVLKYKVQRSVQERSGFWEPADPDASVRQRLARRVRAAI